MICATTVNTQTDRQLSTSYWYSVSPVAADVVANDDADERKSCCSLEAANHLYRETAELTEAAATKTQQTYTDSLRTLTDAESVQLPTTTNMSVIADAADDIKQQVR